MEKIELDRKGKIKNWLYYHRWHIIVAVILIAFFLFVALQAANREDYDSLLFYAGPCYFSESAADAFEEAFERVGGDYNKDGKTSYQLVALTILSADQIVQAQQSAKDDYEILFVGDVDQNKRDFYDQIASGEGVLCLIDEYYYKETLAKGRFVALKDVFGEVPANARDDGYGINFADTEFAKYFECFATLPETTVLCLKKQPLTMQDEDFEAGRELFCSVVEFSVKDN